MVSATLHVAQARRSSWLIANGQKIVGDAQWARSQNGRKQPSLAVTYNPGDQRRVVTVGCLSALQTCPTGHIDVWVDPADPYVIAIQGGHLSGTGWHHGTAGMGLAILGFLAWGRWKSRTLRAAQRLRARTAERTPKPGQKPSRRSR
jgi:hypothetical protein